MDKLSRVIAYIVGTAVCAIWLGSFCVAQAGAPIRIVVTEEPKRGSSLPDLQAQDLVVTIDKERAKPADLAPVRPGGATLEFVIVIDDGLDPVVGNQFQDLSRFLQALPQSAYVGIGYMRNGGVNMVQQPTTDHALAAKAQRLPIGDPGINASPYAAIAAFAKSWPKNPQRAREMLVISDGVDLLYGGGPANPYVDTAIDETQRAGIVVYSIFATGAGHRGHSFWQINWGQNNLGRLSDETGGEMYGFGMGAPVSFGPYLEHVTNDLKHQYLLGIMAPPRKSGFRPVKVQAEGRDSDIITQKRVYVPETGK
jgi:hypothetical protein